MALSPLLRLARSGPALLLFACHSSSDGRVAPAGPRRFAERVPGIENMAKIHDGLFRGAQPGREELRWLKGRGFRTIVNLRSHHSERNEVEALGMAAVEIPLVADILGSEPPTEEAVRRFFEIVLDPARQPVFFQCARGKDRTGTMAALYRIEVDGWTPDEAIEEMEAFGYHDALKDLIDYVRNYRPRGLAPPASSPAAPPVSR